VFRFLVYALFVYIVWRIVQTAMRVSGRRRRNDHPSPPDFKDIRDADFEDLTPPKDKGGKA
jgi:hypothetical protein